MPLMRFGLLALAAVCASVASAQDGYWRAWKNNRDQHGRLAPLRQDLLYQSIRRNFGQLRTPYFAERMLVSEQIFSGLAVPEIGGPYYRLNDGNFLMAGCRMHSCIEKAAILATPQGRMLAAALINKGCIFLEPEPEDCGGSEMLTIFVTPEAQRPAAVAHLVRWAKRAHKDSPYLFLRGVETVVLPSQ